MSDENVKRNYFFFVVGKKKKLWKSYNIFAWQKIYCMSEVKGVVIDILLLNGSM